MLLFKVIFEVDNIVDTMEIQSTNLESAYEWMNHHYPDVAIDHIMPLIF